MTQIPTWSGGPVSPPSSRATPGTTIGGRYSLRSAVGNGGMGTVWRATDTLLRRNVAVKEVVLPPGLAPSDRDAMYERTLREARAAAAIQHPAVVQVYDVVTEGGRPWIVMELLDARSLADMVIEDGPVAQRVVAKIGIALLGALEVAHAIGVLHRDVKPANVLICSDGRCVLSDFGVARMPTDVQLTTPGMVLGSPHFISPERAMGQEFGPPSDLFSLGVTLYTAVEGRPPFDKGDPIETMHAVVEDPPAPPQRSGPLVPVLMGLLEKDPARRVNVHTARATLRELLAGPLASTAAAVNSVTDPYSVVPVQQRPLPAARPEPPKQDNQIGGRAMLAPGESLTDRLAALHRGKRPAADAGQAAALDDTSADALAGPLHTPTDAMTAPGRTYGADATQQVGALGQPEATQRVSAGGYGHPDATQHLDGAQWTAPGSSRPWAPAAPGGAIATARATGDRLVRTVRGWPRKIQVAAAGGVAMVLLLGVLALSGGDDKTPAAPQAAPTSTAPAAGLPEMAEHSARGVRVLVPDGWLRNSAGDWVDYVDPEDSGRKIRIINEKWSATSQRWAEVAENGLKTRSTSCVKPYNRVSEDTATELAGRPAAEFEYTCGEGDGMRHGVWRGVAHDGRAYSFYLTSTDAKFEESRPIFAEMVRSFQLTEAG
ncbi:serine/threonine-protein kinase [Micromonospora sp. WMMA1363]|uniref:serine/threonine-protein kinase n=1 Tax=Micromonospora sp. WMMA1363 TaxID=3053985 RepID=UPI00259C96D9|nr:serine/threonine-protein kinase [Micromonospora sp. WMMA1363]MDM4722452.1 serine/threonine-protein kinase [Micromonospora sp. WMMA1363]